MILNLRKKNPSFSAETPELPSIKGVRAFSYKKRNRTGTKLINSIAALFKVDGKRKKWQKN
jgi:hypothetical protein